jgi:hypothetical protein
MAWLILLAAPVCSVVVGDFKTDKAGYVAFPKHNILFVYSSAWLGALFQAVVNPIRDKV